MNDDIWNYFLPTRVVFGCGCLSKLGDVVEGEKVFLVAAGHIAKDETLMKKISSSLGNRSIAIFTGVEENPSFQTVDEGVRKLKEAGCSEVVAVGGGSVLDAAKLIALVSTNGGSSREYAFEGKKPTIPSLPITAVPTTAGTASEVNSFAVVSDKQNGLKAPVRVAPFMYPKTALLDPELTLSCPKGVTANSGADALVHAIECVFSTRSTPVSEALAFKSLELVWNNLRKAVEDGSNVEVRLNMLLGSMMAGMAFSNTGTGNIHALSYPLTARFGITHGNACSLSTPELFVFNARAEKEKAKKMSKILGAENPLQAKEKLFSLFQSIGLKTRLSEFGVKKEDLPWICEETLKATARSAPRELKKNDLLKMLEKIL